MFGLRAPRKLGAQVPKDSEVEIPKEPEVEVPRGPGIEDYFTELKDHGVVEIPCPHGHGLYTIKLSGSQWYSTPEIIFAINSHTPYPYNNYAIYPSCYMTNKGRVIPWYPMWRGRSISGHHYMEITPEMRLTMAKGIIRIILAGRKLYAISCGQHLSSLNDNDDFIPSEINDYY